MVRWTSVRPPPYLCCHSRRDRCRLDSVPPSTCRYPSRLVSWELYSIYCFGILVIIVVLTVEGVSGRRRFYITNLNFPTGVRIDGCSS